MHQRKYLGALLAMAALALAAPSPAHGQHAEPAAHNATTTQQPDTAHGADAQAGEKSIFGGGIGNVVWTTVIFLVVVFVLGTKAWPQILRVLDEREKSIRTSLENARREREDAEKLLVQYKQQIERARVDATAIVDEGRRDAEVVRRRIQDEAKKESDEMIARAKREIQLATDAAVKELYDRTANLAVDVAAQIVRKELRAEDHRALVLESIERMKASKN
ncbi:MAG: F0F1 ATP synthase subunit B [Planctomycetes bacterium]|nr:F0F1 ATP synthase subunit B [Planctomycetota bacterium]